MPRKIIYIFGFIVLILSLVFLFQRIQQNWYDLKNWQNHLNLSVFLFVIVVYSITNFLPSLGWQNLLTLFGEKNINKKYCHYIYAVNALTKYIPGSLFQYAGRQVLGKKINLNQTCIGLASIFEILGLVLSSTLIGIVGLTLFGLKQNIVIIIIIVSTVIGSIIFIPTSLRLLQLKYFKKITIPQFNFHDLINYLRILVMYVLYFLITGLLLIIISISIAGRINTSAYPIIIFTWSISWLMGFLAFGAPAGLGVREAVLVAGLSGFIGNDYALIISTAFRIALTFGDLSFAFIGFFLKYLNSAD